VHSYKGGTGKTLLSLNLAATFVKLGKKVCLVDLDFRAPSLSALLKVDGSQCWLNDFLNGFCNIKEVLIDLSSRIIGSGKFFVALANPGTEAIRDMCAKNRTWEMGALGRLLSLKNMLLNDQEFDYIVFDTSPGLQYSSINAIVAADFVIVATTGDRSDVDGTQRMIRELYDAFGKKMGLVLNKVLVSHSESKKEEVEARVKNLYQVPLLGLVPCFCDILGAKGYQIFVQENPNHTFALTLKEIAETINLMMYDSSFSGDFCLSRQTA
jgi:septum site-determining protein MinD